MAQYTEYIDNLSPALKWRDGLLIINHPDTGIPTVMYAITKELIPNGFAGAENVGWEIVKFIY